MTGFRARPDDIRDFGTAISQLADEADQARTYSNQWLQIDNGGYLYGIVASRTDEIRSTLEQYYRAMARVVESAGAELDRAADHYEATDADELARMDRTYDAPGG